MTELASRALEQSLLDHLKSDATLIALLGGLRLYDEPRRNARFPYLTVITSYSRDWSTGTEAGEEHRIIITAWTASEDKARQQSIFARLQELLTDPALVLADHILVNLQTERIELRPDRKNHLLQGVMQIRAVTEVQTS
ncbi:DUF3168 domain-containing protein [uncultured Cohaesibacter sp.]|uniref:DUF3168 domain-containing protein n=1 Tax=uncultured Cohaesibacter sp. TaxID=1002546 RepID=UPI0029C92CCD|nr:DUF3168 domain-containing protein [uncultured Cohaesibacter sp.]